jgi:hypothetical protein
MADNVISNGNGATKLVLGLTRELFLASVTIVSSLLVAGIIGMVILYGEFQAMKVSRDAEHALILALGKDVDKIKGDIYTTRFSSRAPSPSMNSNARAVIVDPIPAAQ